MAVSCFDQLNYGLVGMLILLLTFQTFVLTPKFLPKVGAGVNLTLTKSDDNNLNAYLIVGGNQYQCPVFSLNITTNVTCSKPITLTDATTYTVFGFVGMAAGVAAGVVLFFCVIKCLERKARNSAIDHRALDRARRGVRNNEGVAEGREVYLAVEANVKQRAYDDRSQRLIFFTMLVGAISGLVGGAVTGHFLKPEPIYMISNLTILSQFVTFITASFPLYDPFFRHYTSSDKNFKDSEDLRVDRFYLIFCVVGGVSIFSALPYPTNYDAGVAWVVVWAAVHKYTRSRVLAWRQAKRAAKLKLEKTANTQRKYVTLFAEVTTRQDREEANLMNAKKKLEEQDAKRKEFMLRKLNKETTQERISPVADEV